MAASAFYVLAYHATEENEELPSVDALFHRFSQNNLWDLYIALFGV